MNLYKFNFDLAGSSNAVQTITIPTDSKYSMGLKFFKGSEELVLGDDVKITIQDDKYIYTPTEIFNNYAVFAGATGSDAGESKTYQVNFHKDGSEPEVINEYDYVNTGSTTNLSYITIACNDFLAAIGDDDVEKWDLHNFKYYFDGMAVAKNGLRMSDDYQADAGMVHAYSEKYGFIAGFNIASRPGQYILVPSKSGDKYGWRIYNATTEQQKYGQPIDEADIITTGKFSDYGVDLVGKMFIILQGIKSSIPANTTYHQKVEMGEAIPAVDANFKGVNVKTNDSKISNWAVTDSQMKVVYADEWETMKDNADDRVIYFVVDKPTPPKPVPPKPTPSGDYLFEMLVKKGDEPTRETTFDPTNIEDCIDLGGMTYKKYNINGQDIYLCIFTDTSKSQISEQYPNMGKTDIIIPSFFSSPGESGDEQLVVIKAIMFQDGILKLGGFYKDFQTDTEANEWIDNYLSGITDYDHPFEYQLPDDINQFETLFAPASEYADVEKTNDGYYIYYLDDEYGEKLFIPLSTYPQWTLADEEI